MQVSVTQNEQVRPSAISKKTMTAILQCVAALPVLFALSNASFYGIRPFGTGLYLALIFLDLPFFILSPAFLGAEFLSGGLAGFIGGLAVCVAGGILKLILIKSAKKIPWLLGVAAAVSASGVAATVFWTQIGLLHIALYAVLAVVFAYASYAAAKPILGEKLRYKMLETETICLAVVTAAAAAGLSAFDIYGFPIVTVAAVYCVYAAAKTAGGSRAVATGLVFGIGYAVYSLDTAMIACFAFIALVAVIFISAPKILMPLAGAAAFLMFRFFFFTDATDAWLWLAAVGAGGAAYLATPAKYFALVKNYLFASSERAAVRYMINRDRASAAARLSGASGVFRSMAESLSALDVPAPDYAGSLKNKCCAVCDHYPKCAGAALDRALDEMLKTVLEKGRTSVADIPAYLSDRCASLARLMNAASAIGEAHKTLMLQNETERNARGVISAQMYGMTGVLKDLADAAAVPVSYDAEREKVLTEELNYAGIAAAESLIAGEAVTLIVRTESYDRKAIEKTVSRVLRRASCVVSVDDTALSGFCCVALSARPRYDVVFGVAAAAKTAGAKSGDTHSFIKIDGHRFMMALCDGMGSGEHAEKTSETAIGLVENFYRAGFSSELVLKSVNRFLSAGGGENFSALDICVVDLDTARADIIKLGSPATYIKRKETVERFDGKSAPIGVLDAIEPSSASINLADGDMLILASDGVADSFDGDKMAAAVNNLRTLNPQTLSEGLLEHTLFNCGGKPRDDSTVLAARIIPI